MLLCEQIVRNANGRRTSLLDTFHQWDAATLPTVIPRCSVWIELTAGHGQTPLIVRLARVTAHDVDGDVLFEAGFTVAFADPRTIHSHQLTIVGLELPEQGEYRLAVIAYGLPLFERRLVVQPHGEPRP